MQRNVLQRRVEHTCTSGMGVYTSMVLELFHCEIVRRYYLQCAHQASGDQSIIARGNLHIIV